MINKVIEGTEKKMETFQASNDNLFLNSWFTINQTKFTTGTAGQYANKYTLDMWKASYGNTGTDGTITSTNNGITITASSNGDFWLMQPFENYVEDDQIYTISIKLDNGEILYKTFKYYTDLSITINSSIKGLVEYT